ncbi:transcriptional regulator, TetR family [Methylophilus rhizosphaerae]|uniref:Transcriptional regulator, TetR family n=1 Tax=Methylophilus rhizosphaerae TaxID=492660 RepID=A0A1G9DTW0_9PROT|nr:TetR/AcrR family transcriptional regulator [Methylophilus rhizosphaerae]SDK67323.1 transcriptional regulator, TetR family [Methylophilus rhizosphaerae]
MSAAEIKAKILGVATSLFEAKGINACAVDMIINASGVARATMYRHFPSKDTLIMAFLRSKADAFYEWLNRGLRNQKGKPADKLIALCILMEEWIGTPNFKGLPFHIGTIEFPEPDHPVNQFSITLAKELQEYFSALAKEAGAPDPAGLSQQIIMLFEGAALVERVAPGSNAAAKAKDAALLIIRGTLK